MENQEQESVRLIVESTGFPHQTVVKTSDGKVLSGLTGITWHICQGQVATLTVEVEDFEKIHRVLEGAAVINGDVTEHCTVDVCRHGEFVVPVEPTESADEASKS